MGNANVVCNEDCEQEIQATIEDVVRRFAATFPASYKNKLVVRVRQRFQPGIVKPPAGPNYALPPAPRTPAPIKRGILSKKGAKRRNWLDRYFVINNEEKNYLIEYFESDAAGASRHGELEPLGYRAMNFTEDEEIRHGDYGIKLVPLDSKKRTWMFKADCREDQLSWHIAFHYACSHASAPRPEADVVYSAFDVAFRKVRAHYGYFDHIECDLSPPEHLAFLMVRVIDESSLNAIERESAETSPEVSNQEKVETLRRAVEHAAIAAATAAWRSSTALISSVKQTIVLAASKALAQLDEREACLRGRIRELVEAKVMHGIAAMKRAALMPFINQFKVIVGEAYESALVSFYNTVARRCLPAIAEGSLTRSAIFELDHDALGLNFEGMMNVTTSVIFDRRMNGLGSVFLPTNTIRMEVWMEIHHRLENAIYKFSKGGSAPQEGVDPMAQAADDFKQTVRDLRSDMALSMVDLIVRLSCKFLSAQVYKELVVQVLEEVSSLEEEVPEPLKELIDLTEITEELLHAMLRESIQADMESSLSEQLEKLRTTETEALASFAGCTL
uniref:PH domain-containing protein n=1 Tax=Phaeomonas parva TaxID=124430 RepID=A0A7S1TWE6_9STRA|mmetsp:Transcript_20843/g.63464  ORF Transcript_20843/g.63464 Transcript_20843/m.63464 type:complete len:560 (+) Transcript_20843:209-1888(+)